MGNSGNKGITGEKGPKGNKGDKGDKGDIEQVFLNKDGIVTNIPEVQRFNKPQIKIIKKNNE